MDINRLLKQLEECAVSLGYEIRYDKGKFESGACKVGDKHFLVLRKGRPEEEYAEVIGRTLLNSDLDNVFLVPIIREYLDSLKL